MRKKEQSSLPTSDYLNFIKMNKLKLLDRRSNSNPKIFYKVQKFKNLNPEEENDQGYLTIDQHQLSIKNNPRNLNFEMHYKAYVGQPIFNRLQQIKPQHITIDVSLEDKAKKISRLIQQSERQKKFDQNKCMSRKQKSLEQKSIIALATIQKATGQIKFPTIRKGFVKPILSSTTSRDKLIDKSLFKYDLESNENPSSKRRISSKVEHQKIIQTFHQYEKILKQKQMHICGIPPIRQVLRQQQQMILKPLRKRMKTQILQQTSQSIDRQQIKQEILEGKSKSLIPTKKIVKKLTFVVNKPNIQNPLSTTDQILSNPTKLLKKKGNEVREQTVYEMKIKNYKQFVFQMNFAHNRLDFFHIKDEIVKSQKGYKAFIGKGNNNLLIKELLKRRHWWSFQEDPSKCHFIWSQLKINSIFQLQQTVSKQQKQRTIVQKQLNLKDKLKKKTKNQKQISKGKFKGRQGMKIGLQKIFDQIDINIYKNIIQQGLDLQKLQGLSVDKKLLIINDRQKYKVHNHLQQNYHIGNKKALFYNMKQYCTLIGKNVFQYLPLTFHIKQGFRDKEYIALVNQFKKRDLSRKTTKKGPKNIWIIKPGEISNRGSGITVVNNILDLNKALKQKQKHINGTSKTYIVQSYLDKPLLYNKRKFDIRHYMLITSLHGQIKAYWYSEGYIRTSSEEFSLQNLKNSMVHLTNDAIQKNGQTYGQFQQGNKLSYNDLQRYLDSTYPDKKINFYNHIYPKMKEIATHAICATYLKLNPKQLQHGFQVLGLDFMIDQDFNVWMIQINTNPCLQISSQLLGRIIPNMIQQTLRLTIDVIFPPSSHHPNTQKHLFPDYSLDHLKFELVFDEQRDGFRLEQLFKNAQKIQCGQIQNTDQVFENQGSEDIFKIQQQI